MPAFFEQMDKVKPVFDLTYTIVLFMCKLLLIADILITVMSIIGRYVPFIPDPAWSEEVVLTCMAYMAVLSAALAIRRGAHIRMTALDHYLPEGLLRFLDILSDIGILILAVVMIVAGWQSELSAELCAGPDAEYTDGRRRHLRKESPVRCRDSGYDPSDGAAVLLLHTQAV